MAKSISLKPGKSSNGKAARSSEPEAAATPKATRPAVPKKTKTAVCLTEEAMKRLGAACVVHELDQSEIVEWLIQEKLSGYVVQVRQAAIPIGKPYDQPNLSAPTGSTGQANSVESTGGIPMPDLSAATQAAVMQGTN